MTRQPSRSDALIAAMHHAALKALAAAPHGQLQKQVLMQAIESAVLLDEWARTVYENGNTRWRSIFAFASVGLVKGGYVTKSRGVWSITDEGRAVVAAPYDGPAFLKEVRSRYLDWKMGQLAANSILASSGTVAVNDNEEAEDAGDDALFEQPEDRMSRTLHAAHEALAAELIENIKQCEPAFFEKLVLDLLLKMGYGRRREDAGRTVGQSGDGGVDGIINEDPLGLDTSYLQAKRWDGSVGEGPIRDFIGALDLKGVKKGVFLTTSHYTPAAKAAVEGIRSDKKIVLIDGAHLARLMIAHDLGVSVAQTFALKRLDTDFFAQE
jgi:restriction system protein